MYAGESVSAPGIISLSGIIMAAIKLLFIFRFSLFLIYFFKNFTRFLFLIFLADEFKYFFGILSLSSILKKQGSFCFQPMDFK